MYTSLLQHQRQIKFKSSYSELPEALKKAEKKQNRGKSLSKVPTVKIISDNMVSPDSAALKDLPPSSEVYFKPEMDDRVNNALTSHFGKVASSRKNKIRKRTKLFSPSKDSLVFRKRGRLVKKKMVGRKLIRQIIPHPERVDTDFEASSSEKFENKILQDIGRGSRRFLFPSRKINNNISQPGNAGGPNPVESFRNPHFIETSSSEISSYSFVPEESFVDFKPNSNSKPRKTASATPMPKRVQQQRNHGKTLHKIKSASHKTHNHFKVNGSHRKVSNPIRNNRRPTSRKIKEHLKSKPIRANWEHFLRNAQTVTQKPNKIQTQKVGKSLSSIQNRHNSANPFILKHTETKRKSRPRNNFKKPIGKINNRDRKPPRENGVSTKRGKSLALTAVFQSQSMEKRLRQQKGYPNLLSIPNTDFDCGNYNSGEYFADEETKCQVRYIQRVSVYYNHQIINILQ